MVELLIKTHNQSQVKSLIKEVIDQKIELLEQTWELYQERLKHFESKYGITSEQFKQTWSAEDLEGGDIEYVEWSGEYQLALLVWEKLQILKSLIYVTQ